MIIVIDQTERGLLLRDGKLCRALLPGRYRLWGRRSRIRTVPLEEEIACPELTAKQLAAHPALKEAVAAVEVGDGQIALHFLDGRFAGCLHVAEPDCAVKEAVEAGKIHEKRYENYLSLYRELQERKKY